MKFFTYVQQTPSAAWTITHNFDQKVVADVWVNINSVLTKIHPKSIINVNDNTLLIEFSTARTGSARLAATSLQPS